VSPVKYELGFYIQEDAILQECTYYFRGKVRKKQSIKKSSTREYKANIKLKLRYRLIW
jgi:hypothetical protein